MVKTKTLSIISVIPELKKILKYTNTRLSEILNVSERTIFNYLNGEPSLNKKEGNDVFDKLIQIIEINKLDLFKLFNLDGDQYLFHGSREGIKGLISTKNNIDRGKDFGNGFYLSENFKTAVTYVDGEDNPRIYRFQKVDILKGKQYFFKDNISGAKDWVTYIGLNRRKIKNSSDIAILNEYFYSKLKDADIIIGKIADSFNFHTMDLFFDDLCDVKQVSIALSEVDIGNQYVMKNEKYANSIIDYEEYKIDKRLLKYIQNYHSIMNTQIKKNLIAVDYQKTMNIELTFSSIKKGFKLKDE